MSFIHRPDGTYRFHRSRTDVAEADVLAAAEDILRGRLERHGSIKTPRDAAEFLRMRIGHLPHEEFHVLWLDTRHRIIAAERLFTGTVDGTAVHPREVVRRALEVNAAAVVLAHNHPSGVAERVVVRVADAADRRLDTCSLEALGTADRHVLHTAITVVDQIVAQGRLALVQRLLQDVEHEVCPHEGDTLQPTMRRANTSTTKAT